MNAEWYLYVPCSLHMKTENKTFLWFLNHLSVAANKLNVTASNLWGKIDAIVTDAVTKNLKIEDGVAEALRSKHVPYHILCKSHTCERLDTDILTTLSQVQAKVCLRETLSKREPHLKLFMRFHKCGLSSFGSSLKACGSWRWWKDNLFGWSIYIEIGRSWCT